MTSPDGFAGYFSGGRNYFEGNVGVGTDQPSAKLHIGGTPGIDGIKFPDGTLQTTAATLDPAYDQGGPGAGRTITADAGAVNIAGSGGLTVNGNVGIGIANPTRPLHAETAQDTMAAVYGHSRVSGGYGYGVVGIADGTTASSVGVYGGAETSGCQNIRYRRDRSVQRRGRSLWFVIR